MPSESHKFRILFTIRRYNDIDHITPIVYRFLKDGAAHVEIVCINPELSLKNDFRLNFLEQQYNIHVRHIHQSYTPSIFHRFFSLLLGVLENELVLIVWGKKLREFIVKKFIGHVALKERWCREMLKSKNIDVLVVDWQRPKHYNVLQLVSAARQVGIPVVSVPHGIPLMKNRLVTWTELKRGYGLNYIYNARFFDFNLIPYEGYRLQMQEGGISKDKIRVVGSTRFCREWQHVYKTIMPISDKTSLPDSAKGKLKIVFLAQDKSVRILNDVVNESIREIANLNYVDLILKPSTASNLDGMWDLQDVVRIDAETHSSTLIEWADVVMLTTSSIIIEVMQKEKLFVYPKFYHENVMAFEDYNCCCEVNNQQELILLLQKLKIDPAYMPYDKPNVKKFIDYIVYGGDGNRDVLGDYTEQILAAVNKYKPT